MQVPIVTYGPGVDMCVYGEVRVGLEVVYLEDQGVVPLLYEWLDLCQSAYPFAGAVVAVLEPPILVVLPIAV